MALIEFLHDYRGHLTNEVFYAKDTRLKDHPNSSRLVDEGRARYVLPEKRTPPKRKGRPRKKAAPKENPF